jgi:hypothetical protein
MRPSSIEADPADRCTRSDDFQEFVTPLSRATSGGPFSPAGIAYGARGVIASIGAGSLVVEGKVWVRHIPGFLGPVGSMPPLLHVVVFAEKVR